jgi:hypothetical protein
VAAASGEDKETTKYKEEKRKKPEALEGMPQHQHCPPAKDDGDGNPKYA